MILLRSLGAVLLAQQSLTHEALSVRLGVSRSQAGHLVSGRRSPSPTVRKRARGAFQIPVEAWDQPFEDAPPAAQVDATTVVHSGEDSVRERALQLSVLVTKLMADANSSGIAAERSKIAARATAALTLLGRITGESQDMPEARVVRFPAVRRVLEAVVAACAPWPEAQRAVASTLKRYG